MSKLIAILISTTLIILLSGCQKGEPDGRNIILNESELPIILSETQASVEIHFRALDHWNASIAPSQDEWCQLINSYSRSGDAGPATIKIQATINRTHEPRTTTLTIRSGDSQRHILITQVATETLTTSCAHHKISPASIEIDLHIESNVKVEYVPSTEPASWLNLIEVRASPGAKEKTQYTFRYKSERNASPADRTTSLLFKSNKYTSSIQVTQGGTDNPNYYESTDYSADGAVIQLNQATQGNGIDVVFMGDAFSDQLIADGTYLKLMRHMADIFFNKEPYKTFRYLFNVHAITVISKNHSYFPNAETALGTYFGETTMIGGNNNKCVEYAMKIQGMTDERLSNTLIVVAMNDPRFAGTCYLYVPKKRSDFGCGMAIAYLPLCGGASLFDGTFCHEAAGHGFAKLADEYVTIGNGHIPEEKIKSTIQTSDLGWYKNIDFTNDPALVKWSVLLTDPQYKEQKLGVFEGGLGYQTGVFRSREQGLMNNNSGEFNATSREAIYYRIHKLAYGPSYRYIRENFLHYDAINRNQTRLQQIPSIPDNFTPLEPPVIVDTY